MGHIPFASYPLLCFYRQLLLLLLLLLLFYTNFSVFSARACRKGPGTTG